MSIDRVRLRNYIADKAHVMAREGYGWEDIAVMTRASLREEDVIKRIVFGDTPAHSSAVLGSVEPETERAGLNVSGSTTARQQKETS